MKTENRKINIKNFLFSFFNIKKWQDYIPHKTASPVEADDPRDPRLVRRARDTPSVLPMVRRRDAAREARVRRVADMLNYHTNDSFI
jgi:hypothetical protein